MKAKTIFIATFILLILHALTMISSCGALKKHKVELSEESKSQTVQLDKEAQTIVDTWKDIQKEWLHGFEYNSAAISRDTLILSNLSVRKKGSEVTRAQTREDNKQSEQAFEEQAQEEKTQIWSKKERDPPRLLLWIGLIVLIIITLAWIHKKT